MGLLGVFAFYIFLNLYIYYYELVQATYHSRQGWMVIARQSPWATTRTGPEPAPLGILLPFDSSEKRLLSLVLRSEFYYKHMTLGVGNLPGGGIVRVLRQTGWDVPKRSLPRSTFHDGNLGARPSHESECT